MENTYPFSVPIRVDPEIGLDWGHVKGKRTKEDEKTKKKRVESMEHFIKRIAKEVKAA